MTSDRVQELTLQIQAVASQLLYLAADGKTPHEVAQSLLTEVAVLDGVRLEMIRQERWIKGAPVTDEAGG